MSLFTQYWMTDYTQIRRTQLFTEWWLRNTLLLTGNQQLGTVAWRTHNRIAAVKRNGPIFEYRLTVRVEYVRFTHNCIEVSPERPQCAQGPICDIINKFCSVFDSGRLTLLDPILNSVNISLFGDNSILFLGNGERQYTTTSTLASINVFAGHALVCVTTTKSEPRTKHSKTAHLCLILRSIYLFIFIYFIFRFKT